MIDKNKWLNKLISKLRANFGNRLIFVGLQGSYRRGEATEASDFDVMVVLDKLNIENLQVYRKIISTMPEHEKACGFIAGKAELLSWPKYEIFQLTQETEPYFGSLTNLLPSFTVMDIKDSIKISVANLYHAVCHLYIYGNPTTKLENLKGAYKSTFFILQMLYYLKSGEYIHTKSELLHRLNGIEQKILLTSIEWNNLDLEYIENPNPFFELLIIWSSEILTTI